MKPSWGWLLCLVVLAAVSLSAQEITKGSMKVAVSDPTGAIIPGATVTLVAPQGEFAKTTDSRGEALFTAVPPGFYEVRATMTGFKAASVKNVQVLLNQQALVSVTLEVGAVTETVEVVGAAVGVDLSTTTTGANVTEVMYQNMPIQRNVVAPLYLSAGVTDSGTAGFSNPSVAGASGLENLYVIDGVNNTNTGFGGFGTYSRVFGSVGTGVTTSFIQEIQVKTGGMEAQYGQALGGVINMVTKTGGNSFHGAVYVYYANHNIAGDFKQPNTFRTGSFQTELRGRDQIDYGFEAGGRLIKDKVFWFTSINPVITHTLRAAPSTTQCPRCVFGPGGIFNLGEHQQRRRVWNYAAKLTYRINPNHLVESSLFGDPSVIKFGPNRTLVVGNPALSLADNRASFSEPIFASINWQMRYNGTITPKWLVAASFGHNHNRFEEQDLTNQYRIIDQSTPVTVSRGGVGFFENTTGGADRQFSIDSTHLINGGWTGQHEVHFGWQFEDSSFDGIRRRAGPNWTIPSGDPKINPANVGLTTFGADVRLFSCLLRTGSATCNGRVPTGFYFRQIRGDFAGANFGTNNTYNSFYVQDNWQLNKFVTFKLGLRWEEENLKAHVPGFTIDCPVGVFDVVGGTQPTATRNQCNYAFTGSWAPRIGVIVDPWGNRKAKAYVSFGRFFERIPLDLAERSIVPETGYLNLIFRADSQTAPAVLDQAHYVPATVACPATAGLSVLCSAITGRRVEGGPVISGGVPTVIAPGTKMQYQDEFIIGFEYQFPHAIVLGARYQDRRIKRIVEDTAAFTSAQAIQGGNQQFIIGNVSATTDNFHSVVAIPSGSPNCQPGTDDGTTCFTVESGAFGSDGLPDGFPDAKREYQAFELTLERRFQRNWQMMANWRIARLRGNFEGSFRNDNGQQDPNISSLFDFTSAGSGDPLADQFGVGPLPTDRRHTVNFYASYLFDHGVLNNLNIGTGIRMQTGTPISEFAAHPVYENAGELPVGGRGKLGRTPVTGTVDVHADYTWRVKENYRVKFLFDVFNLANSKRLTRIDQNNELGAGIPNVDFRKPLGFQEPFTTRLSLRFEW